MGIAEKAAAGGAPESVVVAEEAPETPSRVAPVKSFTSGKGRGEPQEERIPLYAEMDGEPLSLYMPTREQVVLASRANSRTARDADKVSIFMDFLQGSSDPETYRYLEDRLNDGEDAFGFGELGEIVAWLSERAAEHYEESNPAPRTGPTQARNGRTTRRAAVPR